MLDLLARVARGLRRSPASVARRARSLAPFRRRKVFCVGRNKTGTTSLKAALASFGYRVGDQRAAELLMEDWGRRDFRRIIALCRTADAFQDVPFSLAYTFQAMDSAFPGSKFVLSVRSSADEWLESQVRFHTKRLGKGRVPTAEDLKEDPYVYRGWTWRNRELVYGHREDQLFDPEIYKGYYSRHNEQVIDYFRHRPGDLLVLNLADGDSMQRLCEFLGLPWDGRQMPWLNPST